MQLLHSSKYFSIVEKTPERKDFHWDKAFKIQYSFILVPS